MNYAINDIYKINPYAGLMFETILFNLASKQIEDYSGGQWTATACGKKHWLAVPPLSGTFRMAVETNGAEEIVDAKTAGAVLTLAALNFTLWRLYNKPGYDKVVEKLSDKYNTMVNLCRRHKEIDVQAFNRLID